MQGDAATLSHEDPSIHRRRLFLASCMALIATSVAFATVSASLNPLKIAFNLSNAEVGQIGGVTLWGFAISIVVFGPLVDAMGMKNQLRLAFICHLLGSTLMIIAPDFITLFSGGLIIALANGIVEAACNPLVATLYPDRKTAKLNQFHVWFPGGMVIGGVAAYLLNQAGVTDYRPLLALNLIPAVIYGFLILGQRFPQTERVLQGISDRQMVRGTFGRPLFWILLFCMALTASLELGPGRWLPPILESGGVPGILVLAYGSGLMAVMRFFAGPVVKRVQPLLLLLLSAVVGGVGLLALSYAVGTWQALAAATVFYVGVCYFWPTMLGVTAERIPEGGSLALALMGATGMMAVGGITVNAMGWVVDTRSQEILAEEQTIDTVRLTQYFLADLEDPASFGEVEPAVLETAQTAAANVLTRFKEDRTLHPDAASALRFLIQLNPDGIDAAIARQLLQSAENRAGRHAFRWLTPLALVLVVIFGLLFLRLGRRPPAKPVGQTVLSPS
ncbi:MAG: sugar MFS transporter [Opitutales bacterium]